MNGKDFERLLELDKKVDAIKEYRKKVDAIKEYSKMTNEEKLIFDEHDALKSQLEDYLFNNQTNTEKILTKLKNSLSSLRYSTSVNYKPNEALNEIKVIREIMSLLDIYDWKRKYSEYTTKEGKRQVAIWEQNGDGQIRNYKVWNVEEPLRHYKVEENEIKLDDKTFDEIVKRVNKEIVESLRVNGGYSNYI